MNFLDRMMRLDRRWIFFFLIVVCVLTYVFRFSMPIIVEPETKRIHDFIDNLQKDDIVLVAIDYDPNNLAVARRGLFERRVEGLHIVVPADESRQPALPRDIEARA